MIGEGTGEKGEEGREGEEGMEGRGIVPPPSPKS